MGGPTGSPPTSCCCRATRAAYRAARASWTGAPPAGGCGCTNAARRVASRCRAARRAVLSRALTTAKSLALPESTKDMHWRTTSSKYSASPMSSSNSALLSTGTSACAGNEPGMSFSWTCFAHEDTAIRILVSSASTLFTPARFGAFSRDRPARDRSFGAFETRRSDIAAIGRGCGSRSRLWSDRDVDVQKVAEKNGDQVNEELERSRSRDRSRRCSRRRRT